VIEGALASSSPVALATGTNDPRQNAFMLKLLVRLRKIGDR